MPDGLQLAITPSAIVNYDLSYNKDSAFLGLDVDFAGFGSLNANQESIGEYINRIQSRGSTSKLSTLVSGLFALPDSEDLASAYNTMSPEIYASSFTSLKFAISEFMDSMMRCPQPNTKSKFIAEGDCVWIVSEASQYNGQGSSDYFGFNSVFGGVASGLQFDLGDDIYLGFSVGRNSYSTFVTSSPGDKGNVNAGLSGSSWQAGMSLKAVFDRLKLAFSAAGGTSSFDAFRRNVFSSGATANGEQHIGFFGVEGRASYESKFKYNGYLRHSIKLAYQGMQHYQFNESGADELNLKVSSGYQDYFIVNPSIEIGAEHRIGSLLFKPSVKLGYSGFYGSSGICSRFKGAPASVSCFPVNGLADENFFNASVGFDLLMKSGITISAKYDSLYSFSSSSHGGSIGISISF